MTSLSEEEDIESEGAEILVLYVSTGQSLVQSQALLSSVFRYNPHVSHIAHLYLAHTKFISCSIAIDNNLHKRNPHSKLKLRSRHLIHILVLLVTPVCTVLLASLVHHAADVLHVFVSARQASRYVLLPKAQPHRR